MDIFGYGVIFASKIFPLCSTYTFKSHCTHVHLLQMVNRCHGQLAHYHRSNIHCIDYLKLALCIMFDLMAYMDCHLLHSLRSIYQHSVSPKYFFGSHPNSQTAVRVLNLLPLVMPSVENVFGFELENLIFIVLLGCWVVGSMRELYYNIYIVYTRYDGQPISLKALHCIVPFISSIYGCIFV